MARTAGLSRKCPPHTRASLLQAAPGGLGERRDSLRPSPPTLGTSPVRADLVIRAPLNVPTGSTRRERRPRSRPCSAVPRGAVLLRARGLSRPSASFSDPRTPLAKIRHATLAQALRSPPGPGLAYPLFSAPDPTPSVLYL